jgi:hypothetical protein
MNFFLIFVPVMAVYSVFLINLFVFYPMVALVFLGVVSGIQIGNWFYYIIQMYLKDK